MEWYVWLMGIIGVIWGWFISVTIDEKKRWNAFWTGVVVSVDLGLIGFAVMTPSSAENKELLPSLTQGGLMAVVAILGSGVCWALCETVKMAASRVVLHRDCRVVPELAKKLQRKNDLARLVTESQRKLELIGVGEDTEGLQSKISAATTERDALDAEIPQIRAQYWRQKAINALEREVTQVVDGRGSLSDLPIATNSSGNNHTTATDEESLRLQLGR